MFRAIVALSVVVNLFTVFSVVKPKATAVAVMASAKGHDRYVPKITFESDVSEESVNITIDLLDQANKGGAETIVIEFDTPGGSVMDGIRLAKAIEQSKAPVVCVVDGMAASMGFYLLQSCHTRIMTKRSVLMAHEPAIGGQMHGKEHQYAEIADLLKKLNRAMCEHMAGRMGMPVEELMAKIRNTEWWLTWDEAKDTNVVDLVVVSVQSVVDSLRKDLTLPAGS